METQMDEHPEPPTGTIGISISKQDPTHSPNYGSEDLQPTSPMPNETRTHRGILREIRTDRGDWMPLRRTTPNTRTHHKTLQIPREIPAQPGPRKKCPDWQTTRHNQRHPQAHHVHKTIECLRQRHSMPTRGEGRGENGRGRMGILHADGGRIRDQYVSTCRMPPMYTLCSHGRKTALSRYHAYAG